MAERAVIIRRPAFIVGKSVRLRHVSLSDADFIFSLRIDAVKSRHISKVSPDPEKQKEWLREYFARDDQAYFIVEDLRGEALGTVRLYDPREASFCWGSWILKAGAPARAAVESALLVYEFGFTTLGFATARFDVRKINESVWKFNEGFGARRSGETDVAWLYELPRATYFEARARYARYLPSSVAVIWRLTA